jgi:hypothetical protein
MRIHWIGSILVVIAFIAAVGCGGGAGNTDPAATSIAAIPFSSPCIPSSAAGSIPCTFWGFQVKSLSDYPLQLPYGEFRGWDSGSANWPDIDGTCTPTSPPTDPCFNFANLDTETADLKKAGVNDIMYTLSRTPEWASQNPTDSTCNYSALGPSQYGECWPPIDLNADGTGADFIWRSWVTAIAVRVNNPTYVQTHAHIKYWEAWNEFSRASSWMGTYNQLVRLAQDANCLITGRVTGIKATGETCQQVLQTVGLTQPIDPNAVMVAPSSTGIDTAAIENLLYCDDKPATLCTTGSAGAAAVDVINVHMYIDTQTPEHIVSVGLQNLYAMMQAHNLNLPVFDGEGSWGNTVKTVGNIWASDAYARVGMIPRYYALIWSNNVKQIMWYAYEGQTGQLFNASAGQLDQPEANAYILTYNWLSNATPTQSPFCQNNGTIYHCDFTESNGHSASLVWDSGYGQNCSSLAVPILCGNTNYSVPSQFNADWVDLSGAVHAAAANVMIGANPILLEGQ